MDVRQKGEAFFLCKIGLKTIGVTFFFNIWSMIRRWARGDIMEREGSKYFGGGTCDRRRGFSKFWT